MWLCVLRNSETTWPISSKDLTLSDSKTASNMCDEVYSSPPVFFYCCALVTWAVAKDHLGENWTWTSNLHINIFETVVSQVQLRSCWCSLFCKRHLGPFVQWRVFLVQVAMPCCMPSNFLKLMVFWPHVIANGVMARSDEPHSPLQVTAVQENIQN